MTAQAWYDEAFFDEPEDGSVDGGTTSQGALWHAVSSRWGHSMHTMCSYHGMFPAKLAHYFIQRFSHEGDVVLDPFSGRGTTALQARVEGRKTLSNDLSPLAYVLTRAKAAPPTWAGVNGQVDQLEKDYRPNQYREVDVSDDIRMLYHPNTLGHLVYLRDYLFRRPMSDWSQTDFMIAGAVAGILHGAHRSDGSSQYLSISMPNTFSMPPAYVRRFIADNKLKQLDQNVFARLREKLARLYLDDNPGPPGKATNLDVSRRLEMGEDNSVDLVVTSPPYLQVVNYGTSNWIRLWWLNLDEVSRDAGTGRRHLDGKLDHGHNYEGYRGFMLRTLKGVRRVLSRSGVAVFVIGDVAAPGGLAMALADHIWDDVGSETGLRLIERIDDSLPSDKKVSRIWGDTKGKATDRDCVLVLCRDDGEPTTDNRDIDWDEPYRDGGPDAAFARLREQRLPG